MLVPAIVAWSATLALLSFPDWMPPVLVGSAVAATGCLVLASLVVRSAPRARTLLVISAISLAAIGMISAAAMVGYGGRHPPVLAGARTIESARVVTTQTAVPGGKFFAATIVRVNGQDLSVPVLVFGAAPRRRTEIGTALRLSGSLVATAPSDQVSFLVFAHGTTRVVGQPPGYLSWANGLRAGLAAACASLPGIGAELLPGLAIGDTTAVDPVLNDAMKTSSLSHLTAVSGANCAVVIGLVLLGGRAIGLRRGTRHALAFLVLVGFVVLVTPQPSVLRSAVMASIALAVSAAGRPVNGLSVLGVASLVLLVCDPWLAGSYGFALSALATAGLLVLTGPLTRRLELFLPRWLSLTVAVPLAAQLACQPVLVLLSPSLPPYGVLANLLAEPASPLATVVGLVACLALPVLAPLGHALAWIAWLPATWIASVATFFAGLPGARLPWPGGPVGAAALAGVTLLLLIATLARMQRRTRLLTATAAALIAAAMLALAALVPGIGVGATA